MTNLQVRKMRFGFADHDVPFLWNEANPAFSAMANAVSFLAIAFEKMIVTTMTEAKPLLTDPVIAEEADAFTRQEGQHSMAHRQHAKGLIKAYPALKETLDEVIKSFDDLVATKSLKYRLAYTADLEATFTPVFKLMLDNDDRLFAPGDDRVASLFLWHFVEEVEHRSSALIIYDGLVDDPWYRMRVAPSVFKHVLDVVRMACEGFNKHLPLEVRKVDAMSAFALEGRKNKLLRRIGLRPDYGPLENAFAGLSKREMAAALVGIVRSQIPGHNPEHEKLPVLAGEWFDRFDAGYDVTQWYTANTPAAGSEDKKAADV
ncbi:metal-dependent hydrolase [Mycolicibacterium diernhoferi]|uniref:Metal-dependent hydrolase n=1 Tax=Mycolicibacterium diernhoferi TaxID=1801 RepID=A0A1Q4HG62_9MYCO|nr:metal-dependent hydrolase [Mycolicibacterium diernhoferi]OJZ66518.1 metal-dependent hydrolase [Mycolicibacterium diernhoferi]OPE53803.1 metal-dependent hydrolase [Mycolicibacterium diernhoferi]PEG56396.1 metal-dependent hydrolase [Mycolicibacterium diernhoferi]QYL24701.1 metal-dependent hydrolase [Mycolicibacterium diernhoferi]